MSVYFAKRGELIKIGHSRTVTYRVSELKAKLLGAVPGGRETETRMHERFAHLRVRGEWFKPGSDLLACIRDEAQVHIPDYQTVIMGARVPKSLHAELVVEQRRIAKLTGIEPSLNEVVRMLLERGLEVNKKRR